MIKYRLLIAIFVGTFFYVLTSICCGRNSIWAENQLVEQKRILSMRAADIEKINGELKLEKVALEKDMDVIAAYARKLSYIHEGEKLVKISGLTSEDTALYDTGTILLHEEPKYFPEWFCKGVGMVVFSAVYFLLLLFDAGRGIVHFKMRSSSINQLQGQPVV